MELSLGFRGYVNWSQKRAYFWGGNPEISLDSEKGPWTQKVIERFIYLFFPLKKMGKLKVRELKCFAQYHNLTGMSAFWELLISQETSLSIPKFHLRLSHLKNGLCVFSNHDISVNRWEISEVSQTSLITCPFWNLLI